MTQAIDPAKLKAAAEHLEWVLRQYPDSEEVQGLLHGLLPLIQDAKTGKVKEPMGRSDIPGGYKFADGVYIHYRNPDIGEAYALFTIEMGGGLTEQDKQRLASTQAMIDRAKAHG